MQKLRRTDICTSVQTVSLLLRVCALILLLFVVFLDNSIYMIGSLTTTKIAQILSALLANSFEREFCCSNTKLCKYSTKDTITFNSLNSISIACPEDSVFSADQFHFRRLPIISNDPDLTAKVSTDDTHNFLASQIQNNEVIKEYLVNNIFNRLRMLAMSNIWFTKLSNRILKSIGAKSAMLLTSYLSFEDCEKIVQFVCVGASNAIKSQKFFEASIADVDFLSEVFKQIPTLSCDTVLNLKIIVLCFFLYSSA